MQYLFNLQECTIKKVIIDRLPATVIYSFACPLPVFPCRSMYPLDTTVFPVSLTYKNVYLFVKYFFTLSLLHDFYYSNILHNKYY